LRRAAGDEGRERFVAAFALRARLRPGFRRLAVALLARLIVLIVARHERLRVARQIRLLARRIGLLLVRLLSERLRAIVAVFRAILIAWRELLVVAAAAFGAGRLEVRVLLPELFLCGRDQAEIVLGMLEVIFRRDRIARGLRVARELKILLGDMVGRAADLHVGAVGLIHPRQRVMIAAVIIIIVVVVVIIAPAHALVVIVVLMLTVSHGLCSTTPLARL